MNRQELISLLDDSGLGRNMSLLGKALLGKVANALFTGDPEEMNRKQFDAFLLDGVGPAAASAAVDHALSRTKGSFTHLHLNGSFTANHKLVANDNEAGIGGYDAYSNVLREFLLPRYAYLDFDRIVDPRHQIDSECGYPKFITPIMYRYMYDRDDTARRVVDLYPDESWAVNPRVYDDDDEDNDTPFEAGWRWYCEEKLVLQNLYRLDRLAGIGHYGVLLMGLDDGGDLEKPVDGVTPFGTRDPNWKGPPANLLYMRPFDEYLSFIHQYETDVMHPRYGLPKFYNLVFLDMTIDAAGASIGTRLNRRVHWTRVVHAADNLQSSLVFGIPRQQPIFNRLLDLRKIKGGSAEMFWKGAFPGIAFEIDPQFVADDPQFDAKEFREEIERYSNGLQRYLRLLGVKAHSLAPQVADPAAHVRVQTEAVAVAQGIPMRIWMGSEEGRLASSQDQLTWNKRLGRRLKSFVEPYLIRAFINRLRAYGAIPEPKDGRYEVNWSDLNVVADEDRANLTLKYTQAAAQYVASGVIHLIPPLEYFTLICRFEPADAKRLIASVEAQGGFAKLMKVDPASGDGQNGKRTAPANKDQKSPNNGGAKQRDTSDRQADATK